MLKAPNGTSSVYLLRRPDNIHCTHATYTPTDTCYNQQLCNVYIFDILYIVYIVYIVYYICIYRFALQDILAGGMIQSGGIEQLVVELHFDPATYSLRPTATAVSIHRRRDDDMDYFSVLKGLEEAGLELWHWIPNDGGSCIELSFVNKHAHKTIDHAGRH